jgi:hypothetical protein
MIRENEPLTSYFISMPKELARLNVNAFIAGILQGMLQSASFVSLNVNISPRERERGVSVCRRNDGVWGGGEERRTAALRSVLPGIRRQVPRLSRRLFLSHRAPPLAPLPQPCSVQAVTVPTDGPRDQTVFLIKFEDSVAARESG